MHRGVQLYTLGQRHGFMLTNSTNESLPYYIIGKDAEHNRLTVSQNKFPQHAKQTEVMLTDTNWIESPLKNKTVEARYRYRQQLIAATSESENKIILQEPHYVPLGQSLVLYCGDECLGGGILAGAHLS